MVQASIYFTLKLPPPSVMVGWPQGGILTFDWETGHSFWGEPVLVKREGHPQQVVPVKALQNWDSKIFSISIF